MDKKIIAEALEILKRKRSMEDKDLFNMVKENGSGCNEEYDRDDLYFALIETGIVNGIKNLSSRRLEYCGGL